MPDRSVVVLLVVPLLVHPLRRLFLVAGLGRLQGIAPGRVGLHRRDRKKTHQLGTPAGGAGGWLLPGPDQGLELVTTSAPVLENGHVRPHTIVLVPSSPPVGKG